MTPECFARSKSESMICPEWCNKMSGGDKSQSFYLCKQMGRTLGLKVTIDEPHEMQVLQRGYYLSCVEPSGIFWKAFPWPTLKRSEEFTPHAVLHAVV